MQIDTWNSGVTKFEHILKKRLKMAWNTCLPFKLTYEITGLRNSNTFWTIVLKWLQTWCFETSIYYTQKIFVPASPPVFWVINIENGSQRTWNSGKFEPYQHEDEMARQKIAFEKSLWIRIGRWRNLLELKKRGGPQKNSAARKKIPGFLKKIRGPQKNSAARKKIRRPAKNFGAFCEKFGGPQKNSAARKNVTKPKFRI